MKTKKLVILIFSSLTCGVYLLASQFTAGPGFPLDDAWIHQTYARNLVYFGQWAFTRGIPSAGSTAPLWSTLLAPGYFFEHLHFFWTYLLGVISLVGLAFVGQIWAERLYEKTTVLPWVGLFLVGEWHLVWSALSGMETISYAFLILLFFLFLQASKFWLAGGIIAISLWLRPDAITLLGPAGLLLVLSNATLNRKISTTIKHLAPVIGSIILYALFNYSLSGSVLPNTFFAKQAEYAILTSSPISDRFLDMLKLPLIGSGVLLLPGFIFLAIESLKKRHWLVISAILWWFGFSLVYALRLPVSYQYGRYLIPSMPVFFILGLVGTGFICQSVNQQILSSNGIGLVCRLNIQTIARIGIKAWQATIVIVWISFLIIGANQYRNDVGIIQTEMVAAADWIDRNTVADARIAAHDIGAIGYFAARPVIDLAGLVSPEVIPFIRNESRLIQFLDDQRASYLLTFPGWYPEIVAGRRILYKTNGKYAPSQGGENMVIYAWP